MAKKLTKEERQKLRETEAKKQKTKKTIYIVSFVVALLLGIIFTISSIINLYKLGEFEDDPLNDPTQNNAEVQIDDIQDGKLIVYNPQTDITIIRNSISLSHPATDVIKYREEALEHSVNNKELWAFTSMKVAGNNFTCSLPTNSKVTDYFTIEPNEAQSDNTIYTLYDKDERIEFNASNISQLNMRLESGICLYTEGGLFQCALIMGNKTIKISGNVSESGIVAIDWQADRIIFNLQSDVTLTELKVVVKDNNKTEEFPIEADTYGARIHLDGNTNDIIPYRSPRLNDLKGE